MGVQKKVCCRTLRDEEDVYIFKENLAVRRDRATSSQTVWQNSVGKLHAMKKKRT